MGEILQINFYFLFQLQLNRLNILYMYRTSNMNDLNINIFRGYHSIKYMNTIYKTANKYKMLRNYESKNIRTKLRKKAYRDVISCFV